MRLPVLALVSLTACGPAVSDSGDPAGGGADAGTAQVDAALVADAAPPRDDRAVWAHTNRDLYRIDPDTLIVEHVGYIRFSDVLVSQLTDLAIDRNGRMVGISTRELYEIDGDTAAATYFSDLGSPFNGLSFVLRDGEEILVGTSQDGQLWEIDLATGEPTLIGPFGDDLRSSGDIVSVNGLGTLATVTKPGWTTDRLASIDPMTGAATVIGDTGIDNIFGIGFWNDKLFGFAESGEFLLIDPATGAAETVENAGVAWWGAAVTTTAPVVL